MDSRKGSQDLPPRTMSSLLSGSIAEEFSPSRSRARYTRPTEFHDPFLTAPQNRYSPPNTILLESPVLDNRAQFQDSPLNRLNTTSYSPYASSYITLRNDPTVSVPPLMPHSFTDTSHESSARNTNRDQYDQHTGSPTGSGSTDVRLGSHGHRTESGTTAGHPPTKRRPLNQDEFDGPTQYLPLPPPQDDQDRARDLPELPVHLDIAEQDEVMRRYNNHLADCAFHFVAKYQFPIPLERERLPVRTSSDRDWTEWAYLLKRLATKRRIPARVLHENQIKQLVTVLENSIVPRHSKPREQLSPEKVRKDDRYILQLISAGIQVAKILMDSLAMERLIDLYVDTEAIILERRHYGRAPTKY